MLADAPRTLKGYHIEERIGSGGFGAVYRARQSTINREVAIKFILPSFSNDPEFIRRFETEAHTIARLEHPHIVPLIDYWRDPDGAYLVMRYLRGGSVHAAMRDGPYALPALAQLLDQIAAALDFAHRNQVIHRDIKPGNIMLDEDGNAYLGDFGIAKDLANVQEDMTRADAVVGSLDYISPEQARSEPVTPRTDIYSLGVTLYEMITGKHPFAGSSTIERLYKHINDPLPLIEDLPDELRDKINEVVQKATAKDPAGRYHDVLAMASAFREAIGGDTKDAASIVEQLTLREHEVLAMIAQGMSNREIAEQMVVTVSTVKWHIRQLYGKLGVRSRVQAIVRARELKLIVTGDTTMTDGLPPLDGQTMISLPEPENPYKGLHPFQTADARDFFGREGLTRRLIEHMQVDHTFNRFLAVVGPSGSGKSSVVRAGLIPALWRGALPGAEKWFVVDMIPGTHPLDKLETALIRVAAHQASNLREQLQRDARGLLRVADIILPADETELVIVIDQFEEVFTLVEDEADRQRFLDLLREAVVDARSRIRVIITLRADYYDRPLLYPAFGEMLKARMETILPLSARDLERAIRGPAERVGVAFEQGLVEQIVSEMTYQAGALPLLQYALTELFDRREGRLLTHDAYRSIGGAIGALANRAEDIFQGLTDEGRELARQMFLRLVTLGEGAEDARRRAFQGELLSLTNDSDLMDETIDQFTAYRLLLHDHDPATRQPTIEVAHEAILREWDRLRGWINDARSELRTQRQLVDLVRDWHAAGQESSYLLRGARLMQFETWAQETSLTLTPREHHFLQASLDARQKQQTQEAAQQAREAALELRARRFLQALTVILLVATVVALGLSVFAFDREAQANDARSEADDARETALMALDNAQSERDRARELALVNGARAAFVSGDRDTAIALAVAGNQTDHPSAQAQTVLSEVAYAPGVIAIPSNPVGYFMHADISPDGQSVLLGHFGGWVVRWNMFTDESVPMLPEQPHSGFVSDVGFSPDGLTGFSSASGEIMIWDVMSGERLQSLDPSYFTGDFDIVGDYTPDGAYLLTSSGGDPTLGESADLLLWDLTTGEPIRTFAGHTTAVSEIAISPDGTTALSSGQFEELILWDMATGEIIRQREELNEIVYRNATDLAYRPDGKTAIVLYGDVTAILIDLDTFETLQTYGERAEGTEWLSEMALSPDGKRVYLLAENSIYDVESGRPLAELPINGVTFGAGFVPDGAHILVTSPNDVRIYATHHGAEIATFPQFLWWFEQNPGGDRLAAYWSSPPEGNPCGMVMLDAETGEHLNRFGVDDPPFEAIGCPSGWGWFAYSPDGQTMLGGGADGLVVLWDTDTGEILRRFEGHVAQVQSVAFSPDGATAITGARLCANESECASSEIIHWDLSTGQAIQRLVPPGITGAITRVRISPDGTKALSSHDVGMVFYLDLTTGEIIRRIDWPGVARDVAFSPDGTTALIAGIGEVPSALVDLATGETIHTLHAGGTSGVAFTPDGRYAITAGVRLSLWDLSTGAEIRRYGEDNFFMVPTVRPDGESFYVNDTGASTIRHFRIDLDGALLDWTLANRYVRELTCTERELYGITPLCGEG